MVALQEIKLSSPSFHLLRSLREARINEWVILNSIGASGGQLIGWNGKLFEKLSQHSTSFSILVKLKERASHTRFYVTFVYSPNDRALKPIFLQDILTTHAWCSTELWALMGDFSMTRFLNER